MSSFECAILDSASPDSLWRSVLVGIRGCDPGAIVSFKRALEAGVQRMLDRHDVRDTREATCLILDRVIERAQNAPTVPSGREVRSWVIAAIRSITARASLKAISVSEQDVRRAEKLLRKLTTPEREALTVFYVHGVSVESIELDAGELAQLHARVRRQFRSGR